MATIVEHEIPVPVEAERPPQISWGAVLAGLMLLIAISWLMFLLGSAFGLSIADVTDMEAVGRGLGIGAVIWMLLTSAAAYFLGGLLAARLAGKHDKAVGMLHGVTVWSAGTALMILLSYAGVSSLIQTGQSLLSGATTAATAVGSAASAGAAGAGDAAVNLANSPLGNTLQAQLKRRISEVIAQMGTPSGGANVTPAQAEQALEQLDARTLQAIAVQLMQGNTEAAKDILAANTTLSDQQVDSIVTGVANATNEQIEQVKAQLRETAETAAKYTAAVLWTAFISAAIALALAILGGWLGADTVRRLHFTERPVGTVPPTIR